MSLLEHAKRELDMIPKDEEGMQDMMNKDILDIIKKFSEQGHSGFSAEYAINTLERLLKCKPLLPLTGEEDEWLPPYSIKGHRQNKRCGSVFLKADGTAEDIDAIIVSDNGGITWYIGGDFRKKITFPYVPPTDPEKVYIEYTEDVPPGFTSDKYDIITDDPERIQRLYERKRKEFDAMDE